MHPITEIGSSSKRISERIIMPDMQLYIISRPLVFRPVICVIEYKIIRRIRKEADLTRVFIIIFLALSFLMFFAIAGCDKEKVTESTEYIHDIQYVELPPDTILITDTLFVGGDTVNMTDTLYVHDTVVQVNNIYDTVFTHDTVVTVITDTVEITQCAPNEYLALAALQYYSDPMVFDYIYSEFGVNGGWTFYLSAFQLEVTQQSSGVYDFYGYIDYWTEDWSGFYALEFYWRVSYVSGDPAHPGSWEMTDPPTSAPGLTPGLKIIDNSSQSRTISR
jgi:hypothetical protein